MIISAERYQELLEKEMRLENIIKSSEPVRWDCSESPDGKCYYFPSKGDDGVLVVELENGGTLTIEEMKERGHIRKDWKETDANEDECLFCGLPEERK